MENKSRKPINLALKIIIPVLILCVIAGIWIFKNTQKTAAVSPSGNPDFDMYVAKPIDLDKLKAYGLPIVITFGEDGCSACSYEKPILEELNKDLRGKAIILYVDEMKHPECIGDFPAAVVPTLVFYDAKGNAYNPKNPDHPWMTLFPYPDSKVLHYTAHIGTLTKDELLGVLAEAGMK